MRSRLIALLTIFFAALIGLSLWLGSNLPPGRSVMARNSCPLPCIFDIVPGQTNLGGALEILERLAPDNHRLAYGHSLLFRMRDDNNRVVRGELMLVPRGLIVGAARISTAGSKAYLWRLGDLLAAGLQPSQVFRSCNTAVPRLLLDFGSNIEVIVELSRMDSLRPETPLTLIHVSMTDANTIYHARADFGCRVETGWLGFARRWVYLQAQGNRA
jgi:hypothetical protein